MTAPNAASSATPGQRFTDPNNGTWVRRHAILAAPWAEYDADGAFHARSQEEAEAASLVAVVAETYVDEYRAKYEEYHRLFCETADEVDELVKQRDEAMEDAQTLREMLGTLADEPYLRDQLAQARRERGEALAATRSDRDQITDDDLADYIGVAAPTYPAPLDPGNPEHLRRWLRDAKAIEAKYRIFEGIAAAASPFAHLAHVANRLDRERAEAEQEQKARELATEIARGCWPFDSFENAVFALTQAVRAGGAERQEAGQ